MKIKIHKGNKGDRDKKISIETKGDEFFNHARLMLLINILAENEWYLYKGGEWDKKGKDYLFSPAINEAIELGIRGIILKDDANESILKDFCKRHHLKYSLFKQSKLEEFSNEI